MPYHFPSPKIATKKICICFDRVIGGISLILQVNRKYSKSDRYMYIAQVFQKMSKFTNWKTEWPTGNHAHTHIQTFIRNTTIQINKLPSSSEHLEMRLKLQKLIKWCTCIHSTNCPFTRIYTSFFCWTSVHVTISLT